MIEIRYNIDLFKIKNYEDGYKHYLVFLIRYFFNSKDFSGTIKKIDFINRGIELGFVKRNLENIYQKGKKDNKFLREIKQKGRNQFITLKSIFENSNLLVYIQKDIVKKIIDIKYFRSFCYIVIASRPIKSEIKIKKSEYQYKNSSRTITTIGESFGNTEKSTMSKRLNKAKKLFPNFFNITERYSYFRGFIVQLSNLYSIKGVEYTTKKDKRNKYKVPDIDYSLKIIKNKFINKKKTDMFGIKPKIHKGFLEGNLYEDFGKQIKKEVFN